METLSAECQRVLLRFRKLKRLPQLIGRMSSLDRCDSRAKGDKEIVLKAIRDMSMMSVHMESQRNKS